MIKKRTINVLRLISIVTVALTALLVLPGVVSAAPPSPLNPGSDVAGRIATLFWIVLAIATVIFVLVEGLLIFALVRYRRRYEDEMPEQIHGNATLEIIWTIIPAAIMVFLFVITLDTAAANRAQSADAYVIEVTGYQWYWEFRYPNTELSLTTPGNDLYLPADRPVEFQVTAGDVIHSFWVPQLAGKYDAIPGAVQSFQLTAEEGVYPGQCAEFCGLEHYAMLFDAHALPEDEFDAWMDEQVQIAEERAADLAGTDVDAELPMGDAANGENLFYETYNCDSCHSFDGTVLVGPTLQGIGDRAGETLDEYDAETYLVESILLPCEYVVSGFQCVMPEDYGERMTKQDLADIIAYLLEE
jgi:cytochrome c oxidase subunit 2